jgi:hypothetical protein
VRASVKHRPACRHYPSLRHRPRAGFNSVLPRAEEIIGDITKTLDLVMILSYYSAVDINQPRLAPDPPVEKEMRMRLRYDAERMKAIEHRMQQLAASYNEFLDLRRESAERKEKMERLAALIGPEDGETIALQNDPVYCSLQKDLAELRAALPLWEAMKEYLSFVSEARVGEMEDFFLHFGYSEGNRQAIESALKRHPKEFRIRRRKREKYISLASK